MTAGAGDAETDPTPSVRGGLRGLARGLGRMAGRARRVAGGVRRGLRAALDGRLHPTRRRRAHRRLASLERPRRVVFVCLGNVCRSPYAEARFRTRVDRLDLSMEVASAGFIGPGRPPPDGALREARARGLATGDHRSRLATPELVASADLVVVMEPGQARRLPGPRRPRAVVLGDLDPRAVTRRSIRDPWGGDDEVYADVFDRIDRCVDELVRLLREDVHANPARSDLGARGGRAPGNER